MLIVNSCQICISCSKLFVVTSSYCGNNIVACPWCGKTYSVVKRNVQKQYNYIEIELRKS
jgi:4-hydroxy-3-methylbut-2-en-1-yl diphosphate synthase IspG/GcpE